MKTKSKRRVLTAEIIAQGTPTQVFPLLCPVLEYDWIPFWKCRMFASLSGVAEKNCVFQTFFPHRGREMWTCHLYEPKRSVGYVRMGGGKVSMLEICLEPMEQGTRVEWTTTMTGTGWRGNRFVRAMTPARYEGEIRALGAMMNHYLATGTSMNAAQAKQLYKSA